MVTGSTVAGDGAAAGASLLETTGAGAGTSELGAGTSEVGAADVGAASVVVAAALSDGVSLGIVELTLTVPVAG